MVKFTERFSYTFGKPLAVNLEVQSRRDSSCDLRPKVIDLVKDCDQLVRSPRTDQALHVREFVQEATSQDLSSSLQVFHLPSIRAEMNRPIFKLIQPSPHLQYKQAGTCHEAEDLPVVTSDRFSTLPLKRVPAIFSTAGCFKLLKSIQ